MITDLATSALLTDALGTFTTLIALGAGTALVAATAVVASRCLLSAAMAHCIFFEHGSLPAHDQEDTTCTSRSPGRDLFEDCWILNLLVAG